MRLRASDRPKAEARLSEQERGALRLWEVVTEGKTFTALGQADKAIAPIMFGADGKRYGGVTVTTLRKEIQMNTEKMKRQYRAKQEEIRELEAERAAAVERGDPVPGRVRLGLAEARISAEELRMWGNRELTRQLREAK